MGISVTNIERLSGSRKFFLSFPPIRELPTSRNDTKSYLSHELLRRALLRHRFAIFNL